MTWQEVINNLINAMGSLGMLALVGYILYRLIKEI